MWDKLYRPRKYADVLGQESSVRLLKMRISKGTAFDTSYIFAGGYGRGKTTLSRIHAMAMLCQDLNLEDPEPCGHCESCAAILEEQSQAFTERDAASSGSTDHMRALVEELPYVLRNAPKRIYSIDEAQRLPPSAQDVLLKPMEEKRVVLMFATNEVDKLRGAIRSRCEEYTIRSVTREDVLPRMKMVLDEQGVAHEDDAVLIIIDHAEGHVRNVLNNLEMVSQLGPVTVESVREYLNLSVVTLYYQILLTLDDPSKAIELVGRACETTPADEVATGLVEAAMNCYRMAHNPGANFAYVDRGLAEQLYSKYQDHVLRFAKWFSSHRMGVTKLSLELDVLSFSQSGGNLLPETMATPVVFVRPGTELTPPAIAPVQPPAPATPAQPASLPAAPDAPSAGTAMTSASASAPVQGNGRRPDPTQHTPLESRAVHQDRPRRRADHGMFQPTSKSKNGDSRIMTPEEWTATLERLLRKRSALGSKP